MGKTRKVNTKVTYVSIEDCSSGLFKTQVFKTVLAISEQSNISFDLLIINFPWKIFKHLRVIRELRKKVGNENIRIIYLPLLIPVRFTLKSLAYLKFFSFYLSSLLRIFIASSSDVIHCRSYLATFCSLKSQSSPTIFDLRSLWVHENISAGNLKENSRLHEAWLDLEAFCIKNSASSLSVSRWMENYVSERTSQSSVLIPITVDTELFHFNYQDRISLRSELGWENEKILIYIGSIGLSGINIESLKAFIDDLVSIFDFKLLFISNSDKKIINRLLNETALHEDDYYIASASGKRLNKMLSAADVGIHALPPQLDSKSRLGTKIVEYLSNGLPILINENVGEACNYVYKYNVGFVKKTGVTSPELLNFLNHSNHRQVYSQNIKNAVKNFDLSELIHQYIDVYNNLSKFK